MVTSPRLRRPKPPSSLLETKHRKLLASGMEATWDEWTNIWNIKISFQLEGKWWILTGTWTVLEIGLCVKDGGYRDIRFLLFFLLCWSMLAVYTWKFSFCIWMHANRITFFRFLFFSPSTWIRRKLHPFTPQALLIDAPLELCHGEKQTALPKRVRFGVGVFRVQRFTYFSSKFMLARLILISFHVPFLPSKKSMNPQKWGWISTTRKNLPNPQVDGLALSENGPYMWQNYMYTKDI